MPHDVQGPGGADDAPAPASASGDAEPARWRRAISFTIAESWRRSTRWRVALACLTGLTFCGILLAIGYPAGRTIAFACVGLSGIAPFAFEKLFPVRWSFWAVEQGLALVIVLIASGVTGGIHSPVIASALAPVNATVQLRGAARATLLRVAAFSLGLVVLALLPRAWVGPPVPDRAFAAGLVLFLVPSLLVQAQQSRAAERMLDSMVHEGRRARERVASDSLARARELELLSSKLSHELKNPLAAAKALIQLAARSAFAPETRQQLAQVEGEVARVQGILHEYLSFSRPLAPLDRRALQLGTLVEDVLAAVQRRADAAGVTLERRGEASATVDARRLSEALVHLVANAIEATPAPGRVRVEVRETGDRVEIAVRDTGVGMPPNVLARIGEPFFTTRAQGTGLGVVLARSILTQHGGSLGFESTPGGGTTALASLPSREVGLHG